MAKYSLQIHRDSHMLSTTRLLGKPMVLGRAGECDLVLDSAGVSRRHAELLALGDGWAIRDLGSRNGVMVNGVKITREHLIQPGDRIQIDVFELQLQREGTLIPPAPRPRGILPVAQSGHDVIRTMHQMPAPKLAAQHLSTLLAFSSNLLATQTMSERRRRLCELMIGADFHGTAALLLRLHRNDPNPELLGEPALAEGSVAPILSSSVLHAVVTSETAVLAASSPSPVGSAEVVKMTVGAGARVAAVACPVVITTDHLDILYVTLAGAYGTAEWLALAMMAASLSGQAEQVWTARQAAQLQFALEDEVRRAHDLQMRLIPRDFIAGGVDIGFGFIPCKGVGGDYVDALSMDNGRILLVAMDVAGKGMDAALISSGLHTTVHICAAHGFTLTAMISTLNRYLLATWEAATSVTVAASILDPRTGLLESINCSHPSPIIVDARGQTRELAAFESIPLGLIEFDISTKVDRLRPGEMLTYCSDGLTELFNEADVMLGQDGVTRYISRIRDPAGPPVPSSELVVRLHQRLAEFRGLASASDDVSFIIAQVSGSTSECA